MRKTAQSIITYDLCSYGCGNTAKFKNNSNRLMCLPHHSSCPAVKNKNSIGGKKSYNDGFRKKPEIPEQSKQNMVWHKNKNPFTEFGYGTRGNHKQVLIKERGHRCENCKKSKWLGLPITLEMDHIDGDRNNNTRGNLQLLCPNCHSYTPTWRGRNKNNIGIKKVSDEKLLSAINESNNIAQALLKVGLAPKGGNYDRVKRLTRARGEIGDTR